MHTKYVHKTDAFVTFSTCHDSIFCCFTHVGLIKLNVITCYRDLEDKLQTCNKINGAIWRHFGKQINRETKLRIHNITAKAALKFGSEAWGTEEKRGTTFRSSTDEIFETLTWNNKTR